MSAARALPLAISGSSSLHRRLAEQALRAARAESPLLIVGEPGLGKAHLARWIHAQSERSAGPFVRQRCAAPRALLERELFGVEEPREDRCAGSLERANGGVLFLEEVSELPLEVQALLVHALEERAAIRLGAAERRSFDLRVLASTREDLSALVREGRLRQDLYFRLRVLTLRLAPLRESAEDIGGQARRLLARASERAGRVPPQLAPSAIERMARQPWPGNLRELRNALERALLALGEGRALEAEDLELDDWRPAPSGVPAIRPGMTVAEAERWLIETTLASEGGNRTRTSEKLGISVRTLRNKLRSFREEGAREALRR